MFLKDPVEIALPREGKLVWYPGTLVGRTLGANSRYDVRLLGGQIIANVSGNLVRRTDLREQLSP